jgi:uncharacterized protein
MSKWQILTKLIKLGQAITWLKVLIISILILNCSACMTYYQKNAMFYRNFELGNLSQAETTLEKNSKAAKSKSKLLYFLNLGVVTSLQGKYEESNQYFEEAYRLADNYNRNYVNEALAFFTNPMVVDYKGEDFEVLLLHYYKALNYLKMGNKASALVECKRMNLRLQVLSDKYDSPEKYRRDAFIHNLMGIIYEANGETNDAFIAYRNAVEIYKTDYQKFFNVSVPEQLKKDLLRTAYQINFQDELAKYEAEFGFKHQPEAGTGDLVFFWHNGLGPVKSEWSVNFSTAFRGGQVIFANEELNLNFPFPWEIRRNDEGRRIDALAGTDFLRVAFPRYIQRQPYFEGAELRWQNQIQRLEVGEDLNAIAVKTLRQRMVWEMGKALLRVAIKRAEVSALRKNNERGWAILLNAVNNFTEKADTRAWHSIPHSIYYTRMSLPAGKQSLDFQAYHNGTPKTWNFTFEIQKGKTIFHNFHSLETSTQVPNGYSQAW